VAVAVLSFLFFAFGCDLCRGIALLPPLFFIKLIYYTSCIAKFHVIGKEGMSKTHCLASMVAGTLMADRHPVCPLACRLWLCI